MALKLYSFNILNYTHYLNYQQAVKSVWWPIGMIKPTYVI